ncbi:hypothetical protein T484DRAFT_1862103, partial [Baffinella frigidus]
EIKDPDQLWQASQALAEVEFATQYNFTCQHGEHECHGNMWETCLQGLYPALAFPTIECIE